MKLLLALALVLAGCSRSDSPPAQSTQIVKEPQKARELIAHGAVVLDVRTPDEFSAGHLPAATNVPIASFADHLADVDKLAAGDKAKPIVVYCGGGHRAAKAKAQLDAAGYKNVVNGGGLDDLR